MLSLILNIWPLLWERAAHFPVSDFICDDFVENTFLTLIACQGGTHNKRLQTIVVDVDYQPTVYILNISPYNRGE